MRARITKIVSNQYTVCDETKQRHACIARGKVRLQTSPVIGDWVEVEQSEGKMCIEKIYPRTNAMRRPAIANVDQAMIVMSALDPAFSTTLVDRLCFLIRYANIEPVLCVTKMDLIQDDSPVHQAIDTYRKTMKVVLSSQDGPQEELAHLLQGKVTILTGQSGAGKSTLLNHLNPDFKLQTQETSKALGRGKHTTRHSELFEVAQGWVGDTPGFSSLDFTPLSISDLEQSVMEFRPYLNQCRFHDCIHENEPGCAVKQAVEEGVIAKERYQHYLECLQMIKEKRSKY